MIRVIRTSNATADGVDVLYRILDGVGAGFDTHVRRYAPPGEKVTYDCWFCPQGGEGDCVHIRAVQAHIMRSEGSPKENMENLHWPIHFPLEGRAQSTIARGKFVYYWVESDHKRVYLEWEDPRPRAVPSGFLGIDDFLRSFVPLDEIHIKEKETQSDGTDS